MKKSKEKDSEVAVMDSVGVRTRAMKAAAEAKKRKFDSTQQLHFSSSSSRKTTTRRQLSHNLKDSGETSRSSDCNSISLCSSNGLSELVNESLIRSEVDLENESSTSFHCRRRREITPTSNLGEEDSTDQESMKRRVVSRRRSRDERISPSEAEIEEFFSKPEKEEQRRFAEKYNYDVVKDVPLKGSYEWVCLKS